MAFGVTTDGYNRKTFEDLLTSIETRARELLGAPNLDIRDPDGFLANMYLPLIEELDRQEELNEILYYILDPDRSTNQAYAAAAALRGTPRKPATIGTHPGVTMTFDDAVAGTIARGAVRFQVEGQPENTWMNSEDFLIGGAGSYSVAAESELTGSDKILLDGATIEILDGPDELTAIAVVADATPGTDLEDEVTWRLRTEAAIKEEQTTVGAALDDLPTVLGSRVVETPGHIRAIVNDAGTTPNNTIAQTILDNKAQGIITLGDLSGTAVDEEGADVTIYFDRVSTRPIYVAVEVRGSASPTAIKNALIAEVPQTSGVALVWSDLYVAVKGVAGVTDIVFLRVSASDPPTGTTNLTPGVDENFSLSAADIDVTFA